MSGLLRRSPLILVLAGLALVLGVVLVAELALLTPAREGGAARRGAAPEAKLLPPLPAVAADQVYVETTQRPLFVPTRRPAPVVAAAPAQAIQRGQFTLQGVIVAGGSRTAMLREKSSGKIHRVQPGGDLNGMKVVQVDPTAVTLGLGDDKEVLPLTVQRPQAAAPGKGQPPAQAQAAATGPFGPQSPESPTQPGRAAPAQGGPFARAAQPAAPARGPGAPPAGPGAAAPGASPGAGAAPKATSAPMTPEELLARRRARRAQQNQ